MKTYLQPNISQWNELCQRPLKKSADLQSIVLNVFSEVQDKGDSALKAYTQQFDKVKIDNLKVSDSEIAEAIANVPEELKKSIQQAYENIQKFHNSQKEEKQVIETTAGVFCWRESRAIDKVGIYIPGGSAPLFSTVLMLGIPAKIAGCQQINLCTPPDSEGKINPAILYTAQLIGIQNIYKVGGIQAIAALSFGTESIDKVDKIFGPGNQYVTAAKQCAQNFGIAIDMPAGPSEVLVIADETSNPAFVAADLLSQAEHGADSQVILLTNQQEVLEKTLLEVEAQLSLLPRKSIAAQALLESRGVVFSSIKECIAFSNMYAPEHLILSLDTAEDYIESINNAGSVFLGKYSCESAGDYASGTNHTLPTNGFAKAYSGVSLDSFIKKITFQKLNQEGILNIGPSIEKMAEAEQLFAHKNAVTLRLQNIKA
ncbi:histidinol dehydrogenase [Elizabethkingia sp. JS20170427COW]|uniref:histidinol dehydrogenase n=1 Tax=Elizabethkingia sp. JS20170427COW TaxID=2583851 RepID=UPI00111041AE|nr:histidinol dehydrogenase [Elizabethkingia sp. JS20170427COW]QCX54177.1 histidinol dehydrogenase [Elizabethkingia sp. JS20170427COW]